MPCEHKSGKRPLYDARQIFVAYVCDDCEDEVKSHFRPEIFDDSGYTVDEPIEPEDY